MRKTISFATFSIQNRERLCAFQLRWSTLTPLPVPGWLVRVVDAATIVNVEAANHNYENDKSHPEKSGWFLLGRFSKKVCG